MMFYVMFCLQDFYPTSSRRDFKRNILILVLCLCAFHTNLWDHILGKFYPAIKIFRMQKKIIRIMTKSDNRSSCRQLFKKLRILPLQSQYILSLISFVVQNKDQFTNNLEIHNINTRYNMNLHPPLLNLTLSQKEAHYSGIRLFNHLPGHIKQLAGDINLFKLALKNLLRSHSFYSIQEYLQTKLI